jgi:hypothetical protein
MVLGKAHQFVQRDLFVKRCVFCGYDGALIRSGRTDRCVQCGCDLRERPPRSYAEMEGIVAPPVTVNSLLFDHGHAGEERRRVGPRWLSFLFLVVVGLSLLVYLVAAAMP